MQQLGILLEPERAALLAPDLLMHLLEAPTLLMLYLELPNLQNKASIIDELLCLWYFVRAAQSDKMRLRMNSSRAILGSHCGTQCWEKQLR